MFDYWGCFGADSFICDGVFCTGVCRSEAICFRIAIEELCDNSDRCGASDASYYCVLGALSKVDSSKSITIAGARKIGGSCNIVGGGFDCV